MWAEARVSASKAHSWARPCNVCVYEDYADTPLFIFLVGILYFCPISPPHEITVILFSPHSFLFHLWHLLFPALRNSFTGLSPTHLVKILILYHKANKEVFVCNIWQKIHDVLHYCWSCKQIFLVCNLVFSIMFIRKASVSIFTCSLIIFFFRWRSPLMCTRTWLGIILMKYNQFTCA